MSKLYKLYKKRDQKRASIIIKVKNECDLEGLIWETLRNLSFTIDSEKLSLYNSKRITIKRFKEAWNTKKYFYIYSYRAEKKKNQFIRWVKGLDEKFKDTPYFCKKE